jgi:hypothetical protein
VTTRTKKSNQILSSRPCPPASTWSKPPVDVITSIAIREKKNKNQKEKMLKKRKKKRKTNLLV